MFSRVIVGVFNFIIILALVKETTGCGGCGPSPRHGGLGEWSPWNCNDNGDQVRRRECDNPSPSDGGRECSGSSSETRDCNECGGENKCDEQSTYCHNLDKPDKYECKCFGDSFKREDKYSCTKKKCSLDKLPSLTNGVWEPCNADATNSVPFGRLCWFKCNKGYKPDRIYAKCDGDEKWARFNTEKCEAQKCNIMEDRKHGIIKPDKCKNQPLHGQECTITCDPGFEAQQKKITCEEGNWKPTLYGFQCKDIEPPTNHDCPNKITTFADEGKETATVIWTEPTFQDNSDEDQLTIKVYPGEPPLNLPEGNYTISYVVKDESNNVNEKCNFSVEVTVLRCPALIPPINGRVKNYCNNFYGSKCTITCNKGYILSGSTEMKCEKQQNNEVKWKGLGSDTRCKAITCPALRIPANVTVVGKGCFNATAEYSTTCQMFCKPGFHYSGGSFVRTCGASGTWSGNDLICAASQCPMVQLATDKLKVNPHTCTKRNSSFATECYFSCTSGYRLHGPSITACTSSGKWSNERNPTCIDEESPTFGSSCPSDRQMYADRGRLETEVTWNPPNVTDNSGLAPNITQRGGQSGNNFSVGTHTVDYIATDQSGNSERCSFTLTISVIQCEPRLSAPVAGNMNCSNENRFGSDCEFSCYDGHMIKGSPKRVCDAPLGKPPGKWSGNETTCEVVKCPSLRSEANSLMSGCGNRPVNIYGDKCLFYCKRGYMRTSGSFERRCLADGRWTGLSLKCEVVRCVPLPSPRNGYVSPMKCTTAPTYSNVCQRSCQKGYTLNSDEITTCLASGEWSRNESVSCEDVSRPSFGSTCPRENIHTYALRGGNATTVNLPNITATDNSGVTPSIVMHGLLKVYKEGRHRITFTASDKAGNSAVCQFDIVVLVRRCSMLPHPLNGMFIGSNCDSIYGTTCHAKCLEGYKMIGSSNRTCEKSLNGLGTYWSGTRSVCKIRSCDSLPAPINGYVYPHMCKNYPVSGTNCTFGCYDGFKSDSLQHILMCLNDGLWSVNQTDPFHCKDITPPSFINSCPSDIRVSLSNSTVQVNWTVPVAQDNSGIPPTVTAYPNGIVPPHHFNQTTVVEYIAVDQNGNKKSCKFKVVVEDNQGPQVVYCPPDQNITTTEDRFIAVFWREPKFTDNSGNAPTIECTSNSGKQFYWGEWNVYCRAHDNNPLNTPAVCHFKIAVQPKACPDRIPPINGGMACDIWLYGKFCSPFCEDRFDFSGRLLNSLWGCGAKGTWMPPGNWPDCTKLFTGSSRMANKLHYFTGDCTSEKAQLQIKSQFIQLLNSSLFRSVCQGKEFVGKCKIDNVKVVCYNSTIHSKRRRRYIDDEYDHLTRARRSVSFTAELQFDIVADTSEANVLNISLANMEKMTENGTKLLEELKREVNNSIQNGSLELNLGGNVAKPDPHSFTSTSPFISCESGQMLKGKMCLTCAPGTFLNMTTSICTDCKKGMYQERPGQDHCSQCPLGYSTISVRSKNISYCKAFCQAGWVSPSGLQPCNPCEKGFFQSSIGSKNCLACVSNTTTATSGSTQRGDCQVPCHPGTYSPTGFQPCVICDRRSYQPNPESRACIPCPGTTATVNQGATAYKKCIEIDECLSNPCMNRAACFDRVGSFFCECTQGFTGKRCEENINDCASQPCFNNGTCHDLLNNFTCSCAPGYVGLTCSEEADECYSNPCQNNATCNDLINDFSCDCVPGYEGRQCEHEIDECMSFPCSNGANCTDQRISYSCNCPDGFIGKNCEENINDCALLPCENGGKCVDKVARYVCRCPTGFAGINCETNINECFSEPCLNNATCFDQVNGFVCMCEIGYFGSVCQFEIDECQSSPCKNGATCVDKLNDFQCICPVGYDGLTCENNIDECAEHPCSNNALCKDGINDFSCLCPVGFTGKRCNVDIDNCASNPCSNNGSCFDQVSGFVCVCQDGFAGTRCGVDVDECQIQPCVNTGTCVDGINEYKCLCKPGYTGPNCEHEIRECKKQPCANGAKCSNIAGNFVCNCMPGYTGKTCMHDINDCASNPCFHNGTCTDLVDGFQCDCIPGLTGKRCEVNIDDCIAHNCSSSATCTDAIDSYTCLCSAGYTGDYCETEINECDFYPCNNGGTCSDLVNGYNCSCPRGFNGSKCEVNIDDCFPNRCANAGFCRDRIDNYTCVCPKGYYGRHCENMIDHCKDSNCTRQGTCVNTPLKFKCNCTTGYYGDYCELNIDECATDPCFNSGTCIDGINHFNCSCPAGFSGRLCEININDCEKNNCQNNAMCVDRVQAYSCMCAFGFNGTLCETEINECDSNPCLNNGTCTDGIGSYTCNCTLEFGGEKCEHDKDPCGSNPCMNGASCVSNNDTFDFACTCVPGFTGKECNVDIDECKSGPCYLNSFCVDKINGYECPCYPSYTGDNCTVEIESNFDLEFTRKSATDMSLLSDGVNIPNLWSFTIVMWMKADDHFKSGTLFSYVVPDQENEKIEIYFTFSSLSVAVKNKIVTADMNIVDARWHSIGVVRSGRNGTLDIFLDGQRVTKETDVLKNEYVEGGGWVALGQKYSYSTKGFVASQSYVGILHSVNMWDVEGTPDHMWNAAHMCKLPIHGGIRSWLNFIFGVKGNVLKQFPTRCKALELCTTNCSHFVNCDVRNQFYNCSCSTGFTGNHCDINIDDCKSNPCVHGKCKDGVNDFSCDCEPGYWRKICDEKVSSVKECSVLQSPVNGYRRCSSAAGIMKCNLFCNENYSFGPKDVIQYNCGPDTNWLWNKRDVISLPICKKTKAPEKVSQTFSIKFAIQSCKTEQQYMAIKRAFRTAFLAAIKDSTVYKCFKSSDCKLDDINVPGCGQFNHRKRDRRSMDEEDQVIQFTVALHGTNKTDDASTSTEKAGALKFQMQFVVKMGQFKIVVDGRVFSAFKESFALLASQYTCQSGYFIAFDNSSCVACAAGKYYNKVYGACKPCARGTYQNEDGSTECKSCFSGYTTISTGADSSQDCFKTAVPTAQRKWIILTVGILGTVLLIFVVGICCRKRVRQRRGVDGETKRGKRDIHGARTPPSGRKVMYCNGAYDTTEDPFSDEDVGIKAVQLAPLANEGEEVSVL